jgi:hypothetical protein
MIPGYATAGSATHALLDTHTYTHPYRHIHTHRYTHAHTYAHMYGSIGGCRRWREEQSRWTTAKLSPPHRPSTSRHLPSQPRAQAQAQAQALALARARRRKKSAPSSRPRGRGTAVRTTRRWSMAFSWRQARARSAMSRCVGWHCSWRDWTWQKAPTKAVRARERERERERESSHRHKHRHTARTTCLYVFLTTMCVLAFVCMCICMCVWGVCGGCVWGGGGCRAWREWATVWPDYLFNARGVSAGRPRRRTTTHAR